MANKPLSSVKVYVETHGCSANYADGEAIVGCLRAAGAEVVDRPEGADVLIYNTCAVKTPIEDRLINAMRGAPRGRHSAPPICSSRLWPTAAFAS